MGYKEGSVRSLSVPLGFFFPWCLCLSSQVPPSSAFPSLQYLPHWQSRLGTHKVYSRGKKWSERWERVKKTHKAKTLMNKRERASSHGNMHTLSTSRAPCCALERPTSTKDISVLLSPHPPPLLPPPLPSPPPASHQNTSKSFCVSAAEISVRAAKRRRGSPFSISRTVADIFMQINALFRFKGTPTPGPDTICTRFRYWCASKSNSYGPFLRNILLCKGIAIRMSHHASAAETRARLTSATKGESWNNTNCMIFWQWHLRRWWHTDVIGSSDSLLCTFKRRRALSWKDSLISWHQKGGSIIRIAHAPWVCLSYLCIWSVWGGKAVLNGSFVTNQANLHPGPEGQVGINAIRYVRLNIQLD